MIIIIIIARHHMFWYCNHGADFSSCLFLLLDYYFLHFNVIISAFSTLLLYLVGCHPPSLLYFCPRFPSPQTIQAALGLCNSRRGAGWHWRWDWNARRWNFKQTSAVCWKKNCEGTRVDMSGWDTMNKRGWGIVEERVRMILDILIASGQKWAPLECDLRLKKKYQRQMPSMRDSETLFWRNLLSLHLGERVFQSLGYHHRQGTSLMIVQWSVQGDAVITSMVKSKRRLLHVLNIMKLWLWLWSLWLLWLWLWSLWLLWRLLLSWSF